MKLFVYCAGGFGKEVVDLAKRINKIEGRWDEICFIDDVSNENEIYNIRLFHFEEVLQKFSLDSFEVIIANGEPYVRKLLYQKLDANHINIATLIDNSAIISQSAQIGRGVIVSAYCVVSSSAVIKNNVAVNINALIGHDVNIAEHSVISPTVNIAGHCSIGVGSYIGMGAQIKQGLTIGNDVIIGMGSFVHNDISDELIALGNPARPMRKNVDKKVFK